MRVKDLPIVFLSFDEANADANYTDLKGYGFDKLRRVHGVRGFDAAHKAAAAEARKFENYPWFVTVDADNVIHIGSSLWGRDVLAEFTQFTEDPDKSVMSYRAVNGVNAACYGNGGIKIWSHEFVANMVTHEASEGQKVVDFCWSPNYFQSHLIASKTWPNGSAEQAFRSGYREGVKILAAHKFDKSGVELVQDRTSFASRNMLHHWTLLGNDVPNGAWCILGAMRGALDATNSPGDTLKNLVDHSQVTSIYREYLTYIRVDTDIMWPQGDPSYQHYLEALLEQLQKRGLVKSSPLSASRSSAIKAMFDFERGMVYPGVL